MVDHPASRTDSGASSVYSRVLDEGLTTWWWSSWNILMETDRLCVIVTLISNKYSSETITPGSEGLAISRSITISVFMADEAGELQTPLVLRRGPFSVVFAWQPLLVNLNLSNIVLASWLVLKAGRRMDIIGLWLNWKSQQLCQDLNISLLTGELSHVHSLIWHHAFLCVTN